MRGFLYLSGYNAICETLHMDAAPGRRSIGNAEACGNSLAKASRDARADVDQFLLAARQYLSTAGAKTCKVTCHDPHYTEYDLGFRVKRHENFLYVTEARQETRLAPGMRIVAAGMNRIDFLLKDLGADVFWGRGSDREDWDLAMRMFDDIDVFPGDGHVMRLDLRRYPVETPAPEFTTCVQDGAVVMRIDDLSQADKVAQVASEAAAAFAEQGMTGKLVLDLRHCAGAADPASYLALLPLLVDTEVDAKQVVDDVELFRPALDEAGLNMADELCADIRAKADEVLARKRTTHVMAERLRMAELPEVLPSPFADERVAPDANAPCLACILLDSDTGEGAERLAQAVMGMERVRLVGRATKGWIDYANYLTSELEGIDCSFTYPISRTKANHDGQGYERTGLPLDVHVPFTPEECTRDTILEAALKLEA